MKANSLNRFKIPFTIFISLTLWFSACKTSRDVTSIEARPISTSKLLKKVEQNEFDYKQFTVKRINCQFDNGESRTNFRANLKAERDDKILVSISKLNIPVGRVLLTPDSVKYVNYLDRNFFVDDYSFLSRFLNMELDFAIVQSILSNNVISFGKESKNKGFQNYNSFIESGVYVVESETDRETNNPFEKGKSDKVMRRMSRFNQNTSVHQKMYFDPNNFGLVKMVIDDKTNERKMEMDFDDFTQIKNKNYPGSVSMRFVSPLNEVNLKIRMSGFSTEKINSFSFKIPEKYEEIHVN